MNRKVLFVCVFLSVQFSGCDGGNSNQRSEPPPLPHFFQLNATASAQANGLTVECSLDFVVEISGEVSRTNEVVEYIATMGGEAVRDLRLDDGSGVILSGNALPLKVFGLPLLSTSPIGAVTAARSSSFSELSNAWENIERQMEITSVISISNHIGPIAHCD